MNDRMSMLRRYFEIVEQEDRDKQKEERMKEYTKIPVRPEEHERLVALAFALAGKIDSYLTKPSYSDVIKHLLDHYEGKQNNETPAPRL